MRNRKNSTFAMPAAVPAMPVKPKIAASTATMKKPIAQLSMTTSDGWWYCRRRASRVPRSGLRRRGRQRGFGEQAARGLQLRPEVVLGLEGFLAVERVLVLAGGCRGDRLAVGVEQSED